MENQVIVEAFVLFGIKLLEKTGYHLSYVSSAYKAVNKRVKLRYIFVVEIMYRILAKKGFFKNT